jgi:hypothetical protein
LGWDSSLSPDCPWEKRDWADQQAPQVSEQREEGRGKGRRKRPRVETRVVSEFGYGPKQVRVEAEHENMLTILVEHERAIREREIEKREREIRLGHWRISSGSCSGDSGYRNW